MGLNGRGKDLLNVFCSFPEVEIAYLCDPDSKTFAAAQKIVGDRDKGTPQTVADFRKALEDPSVTAAVCGS